MSDNDALSAIVTKRPTAGNGKGAVENGEFAAFSRRIIRAHARRVGAADPTALRDLVELREALRVPSESLRATIDAVQRRRVA